jgi:chorismate dehydratase
MMRIGAVNYLNTKPLVYGLTNLLPTARVTFDLPSRLADALDQGLLDVALVPSIELVRHPDWTVVSDACIACRGPVLSVKLLFRTPPAEVRTLALDEGSRTSGVLGQILLAELYDVRPQLEPLPIGVDPLYSSADAVLVIGDRAIRSEAFGFVEAWDLGDRWCRWAELPFVFAMWVARPGIDTSAAATALAAARDRGLACLDEIVREQSIAMNLSSQMVDDYLRRNLHFTLGSKERLGLQMFYQRAAEWDLASAVAPLRFDDCTIEH